MADKSVLVKFLMPSGQHELSVSPALMEAWEKCREAGLEAAWLEEHLLSTPHSLQRWKAPLGHTVYVVDPFSGPGFLRLSSLPTSTTVLGPQCLLACLDSNSPVPELAHPIYTVAMRDLNICFSGLQEEEKARLSELVQLMAGQVSRELTEASTHLVTGLVTSQKYKVAVARSLPVMTEAWVEEVWSLSCRTSGLVACDQRFASLQCPALLGLTVTVSQLGGSDREAVKSMVEENGATYSPTLEKREDSVLICCQTSGPKYEAARQWGVPCVSPAWLFHSIEAGICKEFTEFRVETGADRTPEAVENLEGLQESVAAPSAESTLESLDTTCTVASPQEVPDTSEVAGWLQELEVTRVKQAGSFLDGCTVFLSGFSDSETAFLAKVLKYSGAIRLGELGERVSHVVAGREVPGMAAAVLRLEHPPHLVSLHWVVASMVKGAPVAEADFPFPPTVNLELEQKVMSKVVVCQEEGLEAGFEASLLAQYTGASV